MSSLFGPVSSLVVGYFSVPTSPEPLIIRLRINFCQNKLYVGIGPGLTFSRAIRKHGETLRGWSFYHWQCQWNSLCLWRNSDVSHSTAFHVEVEFYFSKSFRRSFRFTVRTQALPISREIKQILFPTTSWLGYQDNAPRQYKKLWCLKVKKLKTFRFLSDLALTQFSQSETKTYKNIS